ncbi:MAG TPA: tRNA lysidine(34) synthetase TilS [Steroidobacteraceae bacterium]
MSFSAASLHAVLEAIIPQGASGLVVALSGGADSAALLAGTAALREDFRSLPLRAVHVDHGLQAAAPKFREACKKLCEHLGVPLELISVEVQSEPGASIEAAARQARYAALAAQLRPKECLLTAHHRKDQAETLLLQALRGAGVKGMSAMPVCRVLGAGWHVRPVLDVAHSELLRFGENMAHFKAADPMNEDLRFDRTYLRKAIWPMITERWPGAEIALSRTARHMAEAQQLLDMAAAEDVARLRDGDALAVPALRAMSQQKRTNAVRLWLSEAGVEAPSTARLVEALRQVFDADVDQQPAIVWGSKALRRYRQRLLLTDADPPRLGDPKTWAISMGSIVELDPKLGNLAWTAQIGGLAPEKLPAFAIVRRRDGGETLKPARLAKTQTVQHLCQSQGVLPWMRDALPLVFAHDELIAVADLWMDARWCADLGKPGLVVAWNNAPIIV